MPLIQADASAMVQVEGRICHLAITGDFGLSAILNLLHFQNLSKAMNNASCCDLVTLIPQSINTIMAEIEGILANIGTIVPFIGLLSAPTSLAGVIKWIFKFIQIFIGPYLTALIKKIVQLAGVIGEVESVASGITHALGNLGDCVESFLPAVNLNVAPLSVSIPNSGGKTVGHQGFNVNIPASGGTQ